MPPGPAEQQNVETVSYHDLSGRPGFKLAMQEVDDRWYLYVAHLWHSGWSILDVTDPRNPDLLRFVEGPDNAWTLQVQVADGLMITSHESPADGWHAIDDETMGTVPPDAEGAYVWDVESDPTDPMLLGHYETTGGTHRNHYDGGRYAYMAAKKEDQGYTGRLCTILDLEDPANPEEVGEWGVPGQLPDDEGEPAEDKLFHGPPYVRGDRAYLSYGRAGVVILDVSDETNPSHLSTIDFGDLGSWLGVHSAVPIPDTDLLAVNSESILEADGDPLNYTFLVDVSDDEGSLDFDGVSPTGPKIVSWVPHPTPDDRLPYDTYYEKGGRFGPHNQHHYQSQSEHLKRDDLLFMTYFNAGLRVFDVSNPLAPTEAGHYVPEDPDTRIGTFPKGDLVTQFEDLLVDSRGYVYCTDKNHGLFVLRTSLL